MEDEEKEDNLNFEDKAGIKNIIGDETIYFSDKFTKRKVKLFKYSQERNFVITDKAVYNFKGSELKRRIQIKDLRGITISNNNAEEFVLHCNENEYDYLLVYHDVKKVVKFLQLRFSALTHKDLLLTTRDESDLSKYVVKKNERKNNPYLFKIEESDNQDIKEYADIKPPVEENPTVDGDGNVVKQQRIACMIPIGNFQLKPIGSQPGGKKPAFTKPTFHQPPKKNPAPSIKVNNAPKPPIKKPTIPNNPQVIPRMKEESGDEEDDEF